MSRKRHAGPGLPVHPPVVYLLALLAGVGLHFLWPIRPLSGWWGVVVGILVIALGTALMPPVLAGFRRAGTAFDPHQPASALIIDGPYRFSRNPAYVALTLWYLGLGLILNNGWVLLLTIVPVLIMDRWAIPREERHLEEKFGQEYVQYKARVHRWLPARQKRLLVLLVILIALAAWAYVLRPWSPGVVLETEHYTIRSSATEEQTRERVHDRCCAASWRGHPALVLSCRGRPALESRAGCPRHARARRPRHGPARRYLTRADRKNGHAPPARSGRRPRLSTRDIGTIESMESQWYAYVAELQKQTSRATPPVRLKAARLLLMPN